MEKSTIWKSNVATEYPIAAELQGIVIGINAQLKRTRTNSDSGSSYQFVRVSCFSYRTWSQKLRL